MLMLLVSVGCWPPPPAPPAPPEPPPPLSLMSIPDCGAGGRDPSAPAIAVFAGGEMASLPLEMPESEFFRPMSAFNSLTCVLCESAVSEGGSV